MISVRKRNRTLHIDMCVGTERLRGSLGTGNKEAARRLIRNLESAIDEGPESNKWSELERILPSRTYHRFADHVGVKRREWPTWAQLQQAFDLFMQQRLECRKLRASTITRYNHTIREFQLFLTEIGIKLLHEISSAQIEAFRVWRAARAKNRKNCRGLNGLALDIAILHRIFAFALKRKLIAENPVQMEESPGDNPERGAEPYTGNELSLMKAHADRDLLAFLLLRWTGLRGSDIVTLRWSDVLLDRNEIERVTQKRGRRVILPIHAELQFALEVERNRRKPPASEFVLLNPATARPMTRPRLYQRIRALGRRAGVVDARPHRFRDTLAVDMLARGANPYDVAKMLGDTIDTVEKHYTPFVKELRERVRKILETGIGLEELALKSANQAETAPKKPN